MPSRAPRVALLTTLALLYTAQGIPFGFASEYLPVLLREAHYSRTQISAVFWLQLPWQLKLLWAHLPDRPEIRPRAREILLGLQLALALLVAAYAPFDLRTEPAPWFVITALCALVAATQDTFVDGLAVRSLGHTDRGLGNVAQVAGYRLGILAGGAGLLLVVEALGQPLTLLSCAGVIALAGFGAFVLRDAHAEEARVPPEPRAPYRDAARARFGARNDVAKHIVALFRHVWAPNARPVVLVAVLYKLGPHIAGTLIKPMVVDAHWTRREIGWAVVTVGTGAGLIGAACGGLVHRVLRDRRALVAGAVVHAISIVPLVLAAMTGVPRRLTVLAIASEHFASGLGTTVLFAALMTATRRSDAALHYTLLTSLNALAIGLGGLLGGALGDTFHETATFTIAFVVSLVPIVLLTRWEPAADASRSEPAAT
jgi:predicted MFS family arabinose efflux permease